MGWGYLKWGRFISTLNISALLTHRHAPFSLPPLLLWCQVWAFGADVFWSNPLHRMDVLSVFLGLLLFVLQELKVVQDKDGDVLYGAALSIRLTRLASILTTVLEPLKKVVATVGAIVPPVLDVLFVLFSAMYVNHWW